MAVSAAGDPSDEGASMAARSALSEPLIRRITQWRISQAAAAKRLGISRPRLNDLLRRKVDKFSLDALVDIACRAELDVRIHADEKASKIENQSYQEEPFILLRRTPGECEIQQLRRNIVFLMNAIVVRWTRIASETYLRDFGIGVIDMRVVAVLASEDGLSGARISERGSLDKAAVSRALVVLQRRGLVTNLAKGRTAQMTLSSAGRALFDSAAAVARERHRQLLETLSSVEQRSLRDLLITICRPLAAKAS